MAFAETAELAVRLKLEHAAYERGMKSASAATATFAKTANKIGDHAAQGFGKAIKNMERMAVVAGGFALGGAAAAVKWAGDFEAQLNTINTVAMVTPGVLSTIGDGIRGIARTTGLSLDDLTAGYYDLVSAGIKAKDAQAILNDAVTLGIGGLATTAETVDLLTTAINAYGLDVKGAAAATDAFAQAVADGKVKASEIAATFADIAPLAKANKISINEIAASFAYLTAKGVPAAEVTTQMKRALIELLKPNQNLIDLQKKVGENFAKTASSKGLVVALQDLRKAAEANGVPLTDLFSRVEGLQFVLQTTGPNFKAFESELGRIGTSAGEAAKQMAERQKGLNFQLGLLKANVKDAGITIGNALIPPLVELSKEATAFIQGHQGDIKTFGKNLAGAFKDAVTWAKSLDWASIGNALKTAASGAKGVMDAFMAAPTWLKEAVITGWGLNKLTGGALTGIGGEIAKGLGGQFLGRGASPANPLWVQSVAGGVPGGGGPGGLGPAGLLGALGIVVGAQGIANSTIPNGANPYNLPTQPSGFGPGLLDINAIAANKRKGGAAAPDFAAMDQWAAQVAGDFGRIDQGAKAFNDGIRAMASASSKAGAAIEKDWLKTIDPDKIGARSKAATGRDATPAQIAAIRTRDELHQLKVITEKSRASNDTKLERLRALAADAKAHGDTKTAAKIQTAIDKMKADIKAAEKATTTAVTTGTNTLDAAVRAANSPITIYVNTSVSANDIVTTTTRVNRYGPSAPNTKSGPGAI